MPIRSIVLLLSLLGAPRIPAASPPEGAAVPPQDTPLTALLRQGWPGDRAQAAQAAIKAQAAWAGGDRARARTLGELAVRLDPWTADYALQLTGWQLQGGDLFGGALGALTSASRATLGYPHRQATLASVLAHGIMAWTLALTLGVVALFFRLGPALLHTLGHRIGYVTATTPGTMQQVATALGTSLAGIVLSRLCGAWGLCTVLLLAMGPCAARSERRTLAQLLTLTALLTALLPHTLAGWRQGAGPGELRFWATHDASAHWAHTALEAAEPTPANAWAQGLVALRGGNEPYATAKLSAALDAFGHEPALHAALAECALLRSDLEGAERQLALALQDAPKDGRMHFNRSQILLAQAKPDQAQQARTQAFARGGSALLAEVTALEHCGRTLLPAPSAPALFDDGPRPPVALDREALWAMWQPLGGLVSRPFLQAACAVGALAVLAFARALPVRGRPRPPRATRLCSRCAALSCPTCAPSAAAAGLCRECHAAEAGEQLSVSLRMAQQRRTRAARAWLHAHMGLSAYLWPGLGQLICGSFGAGVLWATAGALCAVALVPRSYPGELAPYGWLVYHVHAPAGVLAMLGVLVVLLIVARQRARMLLG